KKWREHRFINRISALQQIPVFVTLRLLHKLLRGNRLRKVFLLILIRHRAKCSLTLSRKDILRISYSRVRDSIKQVVTDVSVWGKHQQRGGIVFGTHHVMCLDVQERWKDLLS